MFYYIIYKEVGWGFLYCVVKKAVVCDRGRVAKGLKLVYKNAVVF